MVSLVASADEDIHSTGTMVAERFLLQLFHLIAVDLSSGDSLSRF